MSSLPDSRGQFMPTMISAAPETYIVEIGESGAVLRTPVIAWAPQADNPYRPPHPITLDGLARLVGSRAILFPGGMVDSREHALCFDSLDEWKIVASKGPRTAEPKPVDRAPAGKTSRPSVQSESQGPAIEWATQSFKNNSFYRYSDGTLDFVFQIDGETIPPKQKGAVTKIKRDEFMVFKKTLDVADADDLREGRAPGLDDIGEYDLVADEDDLVGINPGPDDLDDLDDLDDDDLL